MLSADIQKYESDAEQLGNEIAELDRELGVIEGDTAAATNVREDEKAAYAKAQQDTQESIEQVGIATDTLKAEAHDVAASAALIQMQKSIPNLNENLKKVINTFLDRDPEDA